MSDINRQSIVVPGEIILPVATDANGLCCVAIHPTSNGQFNMTTSVEIPINGAGTEWVPDFTTSAHDTINSGGPLGSMDNSHLLTAGFEFLPAIALDQQGGFVLASVVSRKDQLGTVDPLEIRPGHDQMLNVRKPFTGVLRAGNGTTTGTGEVSDSSTAHGEVALLRFLGPASTVLGYIHYRQQVELILDPTQTFGTRQNRPRHLKDHIDHVKSQHPTFFEGAKHKAVGFFKKLAHNVASKAVHTLKSKAIAYAAGTAVGVLTENPAFGSSAYSSTLALQDRYSHVPNVD